MLPQAPSERESLAERRMRLLKEHTEVTENKQRRILKSPTFETILEDNPKLSPEKARLVQSSAQRRTSSVQRSTEREYVAKKKPTRTSSVQNSTQRRAFSITSTENTKSTVGDARREFLREREETRSRNQTPNKLQASGIRDQVIRQREKELEPELLLFQQRPKIITSAQRRAMAKLRKEEKERELTRAEPEPEPAPRRRPVPTHTSDINDLVEAKTKPKIMYSRENPDYPARALQSSKPQAVEKPESTFSIRTKKPAQEDVETQKTESKIQQMRWQRETSTVSSLRTNDKKPVKEDPQTEIASNLNRTRRPNRPDPTKREKEEQILSLNDTRKEETTSKGLGLNGTRGPNRPEPPRREKEPENEPHVLSLNGTRRPDFVIEESQRPLNLNGTRRPVKRENKTENEERSNLNGTRRIVSSTEERKTENPSKELSLNGTRRINRPEPTRKEPENESRVLSLNGTRRPAPVAEEAPEKPEKSLIDRIREKMGQRLAEQKQSQAEQPPRARLGFSRENVRQTKSAAEIDSTSSDSDEEPDACAQTLMLKPKNDLAKGDKLANSHIQRPRVKFDLTNVEDMGIPAKKEPFIIEGDFDDDLGEPVEPEPFTEPKDFSKAYRFPVQYLSEQAGSFEDDKEVEKKPERRRESGIPRMSREKPVVTEPCDDEMIEFTANDFAPSNGGKKQASKPVERKQAKVDLGHVRLDRDKKFADSISIDEFLKMETETKDISDRPKEDLDKKCPNFSKLSAVVRQQLGKDGVSVLRDMTKHKFEHFVFLISQPVGQLEGVYLLRANVKEIVKLWGSGPDVITEEQVDLYWNYNPSSKQFESAKIPGIRADVDAVSF